MFNETRRPIAALSAAMLVLAMSAAAWAQEAPPAGKKLTEQWEYLIHYIRIARHDLAQSYGQALLESGKPREVYLLSIATPGWQVALTRGEKLAGMKEIVQRVRKMVEEGYQALRTDPTEIARSIQMLAESVRAYEIGAKRLERSGEYAMPQLIQALRDAKTSLMLRQRIITFLPRLGRDAVRPLSVALQTTEPKLREILASTLGQIEYPHAAARLRELHRRRDLLERSRKMTASALITCADKSALKKSVAQLFFELALKYYYQADSVRPDERFDKANVWYWQKGPGLTFKPVPRQIFCDIYAMRMSRLALRYDEEFYPAVSLWLAAHLKKEADLPAGAADPTHEAGSPKARYYIRAAGARYAQEVLDRALGDYNSAVAIGAIKALTLTAGAKSLVEPLEGGAQPLVEAMTYPDRRVRFFAAIALANALPRKRFTGYQMVLLTLNESLRQTAKQAALMIVADPKRGNALKDVLRAAGYEVIAQADPVKAMNAARTIGGVDLVALSNVPSPAKVVPMLRQEGTFVATPVLVVAVETPGLRELAKEDGRMVLVGVEMDPDRLKRGLSSVLDLAAGKPLKGEEVTQWAVRAAQVIRLLALTQSPVYEVARTRGTLISALGARQESVKIAAIRALAAMPESQAQQANVAPAVDPKATETVRVAALNALSESIRKFGPQLTEAQVDAILDVVLIEKTPAIRDAAAQVLGALDLPSEKIKVLITGAE